MIYKKIEQLCKEQGITIARLERECGLGNATVRGWRQKSPTVSKLQSVADYFGTTVADLVTEGSEEDAKGKTRLSGADSAVEQNVPG